MTLPQGRGLLALLEICQSQRWWKWLITAKDCLIVDGEPVLWLVPNWKACRAAYWWLSFPHVMDFSSVSQAAVLPFSCGGGLQWLADMGFSGIESHERRCCHWLLGRHQPPIAGWMGLIGSWEETNPEWIDNRCKRSFCSTAFWWTWKKTTNMCSRRHLVFQPSTSQPQIFNLSHARGRH